MDAFYASVETVDRPELRGQPVIVGGLGGRGVVAAASYEVRKYGVHSAMAMSEALRRCPQAICIQPRFARYKQASAAVFDIFRRYTPLVEGLSLDEAFLDVTHSQAALGPAEVIAAQIKQQIKATTGLTASVGVAPNKLVAKIASDLRKPDGLVVVQEAEVNALLDPLPIGRLHGIGQKTAPQLQRLGIHTLGELRRASPAMLQPVLGRHVAVIQARAAGIDERPVAAGDEKQVSSETTFDTDIADTRELHAQLLALAERTATRLRAQGWLAAKVTVKIRRADFRTYTRQCTLRPPSQATQVIADAARSLLDQWRTEQPRVAIRLLGVGAGELSTMPQMDLFAAEQPRRNQELDATIDTIRAKFGNTAMTRGSSLRTPRR